MQHAPPPLSLCITFFSGIPGETQEDIRKSTDLILQLVKDNPHCQISGFHQFTPYPGGSELYNEAVENGFEEPCTLEEWGGERRLEDNAKNCPWIDKKRKRLLDTIYCMIYFVDNKYDMYISSHKPYLKALMPLVMVYKHIAKMRMKYHITAFPIEIFGKNMIYRILTGSD